MTAEQTQCGPALLLLATMIGSLVQCRQNRCKPRLYLSAPTSVVMRKHIEFFFADGVEDEEIVDPRDTRRLL